LFSFQKENWAKEHENVHLLIPWTCHWIADHYWALSYVKIRPTHKWRFGNRLNFFLYKICYMSTTRTKGSTSVTEKINIVQWSGSIPA
jgi:hypothetical protein